MDDLHADNRTIPAEDAGNIRKGKRGAGSPDLDITLRAGGPVVMPAGPVRGVGLGGNLRRG